MMQEGHEKFCRPVAAQASAGTVDAHHEHQPRQSLAKAEQHNHQLGQYTRITSISRAKA